MSRSPHESKPVHPHPAPKGGSKQDLPTLGARDRCWCGQPLYDGSCADPSKHDVNYWNPDGSGHY